MRRRDFLKALGIAPAAVVVKAEPTPVTDEVVYTSAMLYEEVDATAAGPGHYEFIAWRKHGQSG